jgi:uncharacterized protein YndB with AHSA1/START domain
VSAAGAAAADARTEIEASGLVPARREAVFAFLEALEHHWAMADRWIDVVSLDGRGTGRAPGGRVLIRGPLGMRRTAATEVLEAEPPARLEGRARLGGTVARVRWTLAEAGESTEVRLSAAVLQAGPLDRVLLALGGRAWLRRRFAGTLERLAARFAAA